MWPGRSTLCCSAASALLCCSLVQFRLAGGFVGTRHACFGHVLAWARAPCAPASARLAARREHARPQSARRAHGPDTAGRACRAGGDGTVRQRRDLQRRAAGRRAMMSAAGAHLAAPAALLLDCRGRRAARAAGPAHLISQDTTWSRPCSPAEARPRRPLAGNRASRLRPACCGPPPRRNAGVRDREAPQVTTAASKSVDGPIMRLTPSVSSPRRHWW